MSQLATQLVSFFRNGGAASQFEMARMFNATPEHIRATISLLRKANHQIGKVMLMDRKNETYYHFVPDYVQPRLGRPAHKYAVAPR